MSEKEKATPIIICSHLVTKCSFHHIFIGTSKQRTSLTKVVKEYAIMKERSWIPVNRESFGHKVFISSEP